MPDQTGVRPAVVDGPGNLAAVVDATTDSGDHTIVTVAATDTIKVYKVFYSPDADVTGTPVLKVGSTEIGKLRNPIVGGNHLLFNGSTYYQGALGEDLILNTGTTEDATVTAIYEVF